MKRINVFLILFTILFLSVATFRMGIYAQNEDTEDNSNRSEELQNQIEELTQKLADTRNKKASLTNQIAYMDTQIAITELESQKTEASIEEMRTEIENLSGKIVKLEGSLDSISEIFIDRVVATYKTGHTPAILLLANADGTADFISRSTYLKRIQVHDKKLMYEVQATKSDFEDQKILLQEKEEELKILKEKLIAQKASLDQQKVDKQNLLSVTKNDEARYQELLEEARKELQQIQKAINIVVRTGNSVDVKSGEVIGTMGNTGYSTGAHLHFSIYRYSVEDFQTLDGWNWYYSNYINPLDKLKSQSVTWDTGCSHDPSGSANSGSGDWQWPMSSPRITQNYGGNTCYNWMYGGKAHPALDMVSIGDISVRSVADGKAYFCRNCLGDGGNGVFVFHTDNYMSVYWHLQ